MKKDMNNSEKQIADKIRSLDDSPVAMSWDQEDLWQNIKSAESSGRKKYWLVAATISLIIVATVLGLNMNEQNEQLSYSEEVLLPVTEVDANLSEIENDALQFINHTCHQALVVCRNPEFVNLREDLESLEAEIVEIDQMIQKYGEDPVFVRSKTRIENLKTEITNRLVQMVIS